MDICTKINRSFLMGATALSLAACSGGATTGNGQQGAQVAGQEAVAATLSLETTPMEQIFKYANPLQLNENEELITGALPENNNAKVVKIQKITDFEDYLGNLKTAKKIRYGAWDMNDVLYGEFLDQDLEKPISDNSLTQRNLLTSKELRYFKIWFILSLKENAANPKEAYDKVFGKLNDICKDCVPLEQPQVDKLQQKLKEMPDNYGIFDVLSAQQMMSYGI